MLEYHAKFTIYEIAPAIVAAIALTHRRPHGRKAQNTREQLDVKARDRVRLVKMQAEKKNNDIT